MKFLILLCFIVYINDSQCLHNVRLLFPPSVPEGGNATLYCLYDLQGDILYSVKWYRGYNEIFRYLPRDKPRTLAFPLPGLHIDLTNSNSKRLILLYIPTFLAGNYTCEVSADEPLYSTFAVTKFLQVIPQENNSTNSITSENYIRFHNYTNSTETENKANEFQLNTKLLELSLLICGLKLFL